MEDLTNNERAAMIERAKEFHPKIPSEGGFFYYGEIKRMVDFAVTETASLRQQLSEAREAIVANYKGRVNGFDLARAWLRKYPLDSKEKHDNEN